MEDETYSISVHGCVNFVMRACRTAFSVYLKFILRSVLLENPAFNALSLVNARSSTNSIVDIPYELELLESIKHSTTSKLAKIKLPDIIEY